MFEFTYNGKTIPYEIIYKKIKNINIGVRPNGSVYVSCPEGVTNQQIELELVKKAKWVLTSIENYRINTIEFASGKIELVDGQSFLLLGRILRIQNVISDTFSVEYDNNYLYVKSPNQKGLKKKFNEWYKSFVSDQFTEMVRKSYIKFKKYNISEPKVIFKKMKTRWGSCNIDKKIITLNIQLIKVDPYLTEYVICHELTHLKYKNHTREFYSFLTAMVPDWKQREKVLNNIFINELGGDYDDN